MSPTIRAADVNVTLQVLQRREDGLTSTYRFGPDGLVFLRPVSLALRYDEAPPEGTHVVLGVWDGQAWGEVAGSCQLSAQSLTQPGPG